MAHEHFAKTHSSQPSPSTPLLGSLTLPNSCALPDWVSWLCVWRTLWLVLLGETATGTCSEPRERDKQTLGEKRNQYMPVIALRRTQLHLLTDES